MEVTKLKVETTSNIIFETMMKPFGDGLKVSKRSISFSFTSSSLNRESFNSFLMRSSISSNRYCINKKRTVHFLCDIRKLSSVMRKSLKRKAVRSLFHFIRSKYVQLYSRDWSFPHFTGHFHLVMVLSFSFSQESLE